MDHSVVGVHGVPLEIISRKWVVVGGLWGGCLAIVNMDKTQLDQFIQNTPHSVTGIYYCLREGQLVVGDRGGIVTVYSLRTHKDTLLLEQVYQQ